MNWRAAGCLLIGMGTFVAIGLLGMSMAFGELDGCPPRVQWSDRAYHPVGSPLASAVVQGAGGGAAVEIGSTFVGLTTRRVYGPPGSSPSTDAADRPERIALECGDGTFQAYRWDGITLPAAS